MTCEACGEGDATCAADIGDGRGRRHRATLCAACAAAWLSLLADEVQHHMWRIRLRRGLEKGVIK